MTVLADTQLHQEIRAIMLNRDTPAFDKRRQVTGLVDDALQGFGTFHRTRDNRIFFFSNLERALYDLEQRPFQHLLTTISGLSATEAGFRFLLDMLQAATSRTAPLVEVHTLAHFDPRTGLLAVSDAGQGVWIRERGGQWVRSFNGNEGLLFLTEPEAVAWEPDFGSNGVALKRYLAGFLFRDDGLSAEEQRVVLLVFLLHQLFPPLRRTRTIPAFLGPQGSGKTSAERRIGMLFVGPEFEVTGLHRDREDAFIAAVTNRVVCALDNADARIPWLEDALATYATGLRYRLRRLYTTNEEVSYEPRALLMVSSRDPQFNRADVAERLLPFHCERPASYVPEARLFAELEADRGAVMAALLERAARVADALAEMTPPAVRFRMADYASFGSITFAVAGQADEWAKLLGKLETAQAAFASDGDGLVEALRTLVDREGQIGPVAVSELFRQVREVAERDGLPLPRTAASFGRRLSLSRRVIELELGMKFMEERRHEGRRWVSLVPVSHPTGDGGDTGDDFGGKVPNHEVGR